MKKEEIHLWDVQRILFGQAPPVFLLEVFIRSLLVYVAAIVVMRWMGKRMNGQLTLIELSVMVMMGAIISVPMQVPDRGILQGIVVLLVTLLLLRGINWISFHHPRFQKTLQGDTLLVVKDGRVETDATQKTKITNQKLFEILRTKKIFNLGQVKRMYIEASGIYSIYQEKTPKPGLPLYPETDRNVYESHPQDVAGKQACTTCGNVQSNSAQRCENCGKNHWAKAII